MDNLDKCVRRAMALGVVAIGLTLLWDIYLAKWMAKLECHLFIYVGITCVLRVMMCGMLVLLMAKSRAIAIVGIVGVCACIAYSAVSICDLSVTHTIGTLIFALPTLSVAVGFFLLGDLVKGWKSKCVIYAATLAELFSVMIACLAFYDAVPDALRAFPFWIVVEVLELVSVVLVWGEHGKAVGNVLSFSHNKIIRMESSAHSAGWVQGFLVFFGWSIIAIGVICSGSMLHDAAPRSGAWGETLPWDQGLVADSILTLIINVIAALVVLRIAKADKESADIECPERSVVIQIIQALSILGVMAFIGAFVWSLADESGFLRKFIEGMLSKGSLSDLLTLNRIVESGDELLILVRIMLGVCSWYMIGFYFVWGSFDRILGRVVNASAMKVVYERKIKALEGPRQPV